MGKAVMMVVVWVLQRLGFWWYPRKDNTAEKGRQLLFRGTEEQFKTVGVSWYFGKEATMCHAELSFAGESDYVLSLAIPRLFAVWIDLESVPSLRFWNPKEKINRFTPMPGADPIQRGRWWQGRTVGASLHHWQLWFYIFSDRMNHDYYKHAWFKREWREPHINLERIIFGKEQFKHEDLSERIPIRVPMPEGNFDAVIQHVRYTNGWQRFRKPVIREWTKIELDTPPQFAGKGENGWDMDDDAIFATSFNGFLTADEAAHEYRELVLKERRKYGEPSSYQVAQ